MVAGGDAPRSAGAGGCPLASSPGRRPGADGSGPADRRMGHGRAGGVHACRAAGAAAWDPRPGDHVLDTTAGLGTSLQRAPNRFTMKGTDLTPMPGDRPDLSLFHPL